MTPTLPTFSLREVSGSAALTCSAHGYQAPTWRSAWKYNWQSNCPRRYSARDGAGALSQVVRQAKARLGCARNWGYPLETLVWGPFSGNPLQLPGLEPTRSPTPKLKGVLPSMNRGTSAERALLREAFGLLLALRSRPHAQKLLGQAVSYLRLLERQGEPGGLPLVVSVQAMRLTKL
jgi:hypothetical protein